MYVVNWLSLAGICLLGAAVPGASLVIVLQSVVAGGRQHGLLTAIAHAIGVGLYALLAALGLAWLMSAHPALLIAIRGMGALFLLAMAVAALRQPLALTWSDDSRRHQFDSALRGFLVAFLNPKLAIFFVALFSQFLRVEADLSEKLLLAATAMLVDGSWYVAVVLMVSRPEFLRQLQRKADGISKVFALALLLFALWMLWALWL
jgi:threonine/homoserine/homoserine lactone efflux protein